ncbi:MAG: DUF1015 family protein [Peptococcaceae bacterium]|nr:DUF1015 family protein [Peptococcaceae bacterium]
MTNIYGLSGLRPAAEAVKPLTCPPYDVIKPGTRLEAILKANERSLYHIVLGEEPVETLAAFLRQGLLIEDGEPAFYVYEQRYGTGRRLGFLTSVEVTPYEEKEIIRHEKTFDEKVKGRIRLMEETGYVTEPIWLLTRSGVQEVLEAAAAEEEPVYEFTSDFAGESELSGIENRIFKVSEASSLGAKLKALTARGPLYIADGHHRYHSALRMGLKQCIAYVCQADQARIQAYNRVIRGRRPFAEIKDQLPLKRETAFATPRRHHFAVYTREGIYSYGIEQADESDVVGRLDCRLLENTLYPLLELEHSLINDQRYFDYYAESELVRMQKEVDEGRYDIAVALHPVDPEELMAVAEAGTGDPRIVMPEKSTFFAPKILSGLFLIRTEKR